MGMKLKWVPLDIAQIASFNIHRSMIGFNTPTEAPFGLVPGDTLEFKANDATLQTLTFPSDLSISNLVDFINDNSVGITAYKAVEDDSLYVRSNIREAPGFLEIVGGTAMTKFGQTARVISEKSEVKLLVNLPSTETEYEDLNGVIQDFYGIQTIDIASCESQISTLVQAVGFATPICIIEGIITDLQGRRLPDVKVSARVVTPPEILPTHTAIVTDENYVLTGEDGRFGLPVLQGARIILEINDVRVSDPIMVPAENFVFFDDLEIYEDYKLKDILT